MPIHPIRKGEARVLVTRPRGSGEVLRRTLEEQGVTVVEIPAVEIRPLHDLSALDRTLDGISQYDWIVFTSRNAADTVLERVAATDRTLAGPRIAAVGPVTAARLRECGMTVDFCPAEATAATLAQEMIGRGVAGQRILIPAGDRSRPDLAEALRRAGAHVDTVIAYETVVMESEQARMAAALIAGDVDAVALASPSALDAIITALDGDLQPLRRVRLVCIGPTTAEAVRSAGLIPAAVAQPHTAAGLAAAVIGLFTE
jgi:uroporphyrinogen-III synthase